MRLHAMWVQFLRSYRSFSPDVTAAILVYRKKSCGDWTLFQCKRIVLLQQICIAAYHVSENDQCQSLGTFMLQVGDNQCLLQSLKDSPYYKGFEDKASLWETRLADLDEYLHNLNQIQRKWVYLEPIFGRGALPREQGRFKRVDDDFRFVVSEFIWDLYILKSTIFVLLLSGMRIFGTLIVKYM